MLKTYIVCLSMIVALVLSTVTQARILPNAEERVKRQSADVKAAEYLAYIALGGKLPHGCPDVACGLVDVIARYYKRASADQRIAELQALVTLTKGAELLGHGQIDPFLVGRKKRSVPFIENLDPVQRYRLLQGLLQAAESKIGSDI